MISQTTCALNYIIRTTFLLLLYDCSDFGIVSASSTLLIWERSIGVSVITNSRRYVNYPKIWSSYSFSIGLRDKFRNSSWSKYYKNSSEQILLSDRNNFFMFVHCFKYYMFVKFDEVAVKLISDVLSITSFEANSEIFLLVINVSMRKFWD